jgi:hypothetical protein
MSVNLEQKRRPWTLEEKEVLKSLFSEHSLHSKRSSMPYFRQDSDGYNPAQKANEIEKEMDNLLINPDMSDLNFDVVKDGSEIVNGLYQLWSYHVRRLHDYGTLDPKKIEEINIARYEAKPKSERRSLWGRR